MVKGVNFVTNETDLKKLRKNHIQQWFSTFFSEMAHSVYLPIFNADKHLFYAIHFTWQNAFGVELLFWYELPFLVYDELPYEWAFLDFLPFNGLKHAPLTGIESRAWNLASVLKLLRILLDRFSFSLFEWVRMKTKLVENEY